MLEEKSEVQKKTALNVVRWIACGLGLLLAAQLFVTFFPLTHQQRIKWHLRALEFWSREIVNATTPADHFAFWWRHNFAGGNISLSARLQAEEKALQNLGFFTNVTFSLARPLTNRDDYKTFHAMIRSAKFEDDHWSYSFSTNQLQALICNADFAAWKAVVDKWNSAK
jgi:hypothetical protein